MASAKMLNLERVKARLRRLPQAMKAAVEEQLTAEAEELAAAMRRAAPVITGALRGSIRVEDGDRPLSKKVIAGGVPETRKRVRKGVADADFAKAKATGGFKGEFDYSRGVEFGHRTPAGGHVAAEPFFYPTYRARKKAMRRRLTTAARKALKKIYPE